MAKGCTGLVQNWQCTDWCQLVCRVAELELLRGHERSDHDKLDRLEVCTQSLVKGLQLERDMVTSCASVLASVVSSTDICSCAFDWIQCFASNSMYMQLEGSLSTEIWTGHDMDLLTCMAITCGTAVHLLCTCWCGFSCSQVAWVATPHIAPSLIV